VSFLESRVLAGCRHGFGTRTSSEPAALLRPRQVHGSSVWVLEEVAVRPAEGGAAGVEADAIVSIRAATPVGVVTADCVPILVATGCGRAVAAVHAGWRGLAAGVIEAAARELRAAAARIGAGGALRAAVGPRIDRCCYEVDAPVIEPLRARFGERLDAALEPSRPAHARLDLGLLAQEALLRAGLEERHLEVLADVCTACSGGRFHSYRRDGPGAGRLVHFIEPREASLPAGGRRSRPGRA
jgi:hypothetical protein